MYLSRCRLCFTNPGSNSIFDEENGIRNKINYCCPMIVIVKEDGLPAGVCQPCEELLHTAYKFIHICKATDEMLRHKIKNDFSHECTDINHELESSSNKLNVKLENSHSSDSDNLKYDEAERHCSNDIQEFHSDNEQKDQTDDIKDDQAEHYSNDLHEFDSDTQQKDQIDGHSNNYITENKSEIILEDNTRKVVKKCTVYKNNKSPNKQVPKYKQYYAFVCGICGCNKKSKSALAVHMHTHTSNELYHCQECSKKFKYSTSLVKHVRNLHSGIMRERKFICEFCGKGFFTKNAGTVHKRQHTGETPYECSECLVSFNQVSSLRRHKMTAHSKEFLYACTICSKKFNCKDKLRSHQNVHTDEKKYQCSICKVNLKYLSGYKKHMTLHLDPANFICNYCGRGFNQKGSLKSHIKNIHSEKSGFCNICTKMVSNIETHSWKHTGFTPYKCDYCSLSYSNKNALARHVSFRHKHKDKFKCSVPDCHEAFPLKNMLTFHISKAHEGNVLYPCKTCSKKYYRKTDLSRHMIGTHKVSLVI